jgi:hypothetical protein
MVSEQLKTAFILRNETIHMAGYACFSSYFVGLQTREIIPRPITPNDFLRSFHGKTLCKLAAIKEVKIYAEYITN